MLETGEKLLIASRKSLGEARKLVYSLAEFWPAEYAIEAVGQKRRWSWKPPHIQGNSQLFH
jgi:hypothetical protein